MSVEERASSIESLYYFNVHGRRRIQAELQDDGIRAGAKRVARLMKERHCHGGFAAQMDRDDHARREATAYADLVKRDFTASRPNQLWVAAIMYVPAYAGFFFIAVVLNVYSRRVVAWAMANHMRKELVVDETAKRTRYRRRSGGTEQSVRCGLRTIRLRGVRRSTTPQA